MANIWYVDVKKFVWRNIVIRFGVPESLVSGNGLHFDSKAFREFCSSLNITNWYSTPAYPQSNGQVEATTKAIVNGLKKRLEGAKADGQRSCLMFYGHTKQLRRGLQEKLRSL